MNKTYILAAIASITASFSLHAALVDDDGNLATNETALADIDTAASTVGDLKQEVNKGYATTQQVETAVSNLDYKIAIDTNFVRRTDNNFMIGNGNSLGLFSSAIGSNNTLGNRSFAFGFNNSMQNNQQYAFGFGNKSLAQNSFTAGIGSGATTDGSYSITLGTMSVSSNLGSFVWSWYPTDYSSAQADEIFDIFPKYYSHGDGTFNVNPIGGLRGFWIGDTNLEEHIYRTVTPPIVEAAIAVESSIMSNVTETAFQGYGWPFGDWTHNQPTLLLSVPVWTNSLWRYTETNELGETVGSARWIESADGIDAVQLVDTLNGTNVVWSRSGTPVHTNVLGFATTSNLAQYVKHTQLEQKLKGYVDNDTLNGYDASYKMVEGLTDENQTIQFVLNTNSVSSPLEILLPANGRCKDWIVYVLSEVDMPLVLPNGSYWIKSEAVTNDVAAGVPTALYFSQVSAEGLYTIGRQEFTTPITIMRTSGPPMLNAMQRIMSTASGKKKQALKSSMPIKSNAK